MIEKVEKRSREAGWAHRDVGEEGVAQASTVCCSLDEASDVDDLKEGGDGALGLVDVDQPAEPLVRNVDTSLGSGTSVPADACGKKEVHRGEANKGSGGHQGEGGRWGLTKGRGVRQGR